MYNFAASRFGDLVQVHSAAPIERLKVYVLALVLIGLALVATLALQSIYAYRPPLFLFFAAVAGAAWLGGRGPGFVAAGTALPFGLHFYAVARPGHGLYGRDILLLVFFAACALVGAALYAWRRKAEAGLRSAHHLLQAKADELQRANDALVAEMAERARTETVLEKTRTDLARAARLTSMAEMAATIAHEINQPLTAMMTNAGACVRWLNAPAPDIGEAREAASRVVRDAERAGQVVARIRATAKTVRTRPTEVSIRACLKEVLALLQSEIDKDRVSVQTAIDAGLPSLSADRIQLQQVFVNLIMNALESLARVQDRPRRLRITAGRDDGDMLKIEIRDNGEGFAEGVFDRLYDSFVTTKAGGMGMGLSICRSIIAAHGGTLAAASVLPAGAAFTITLPGSKT